MRCMTYLVWVEDKVEFTDILKALVEDFHEDLNQVKHCEFTLCVVNDEDECQRGIHPIPQSITLFNH